MIKKIFWGLLILLVLAQLYRPAKNLSGDSSNNIVDKYKTTDEVKAILKTSCYDCHSNKTEYPWYSDIQPVASFMANHVNEGKRELNFDELSAKKIGLQNHKLEELVKMVDEGEMPLSSYTLIHRNAVLTQDKKDALTSWAKGIMADMKANFPADSLVLKKRN